MILHNQRVFHKGSTSIVSVEECEDGHVATIWDETFVVYHVKDDVWESPTPNFTYTATVYHNGEKLQVPMTIERTRDYATIEGQQFKIYPYETRQSTPVSNDILSYTTSKEAADKWRAEHPHIEHDPWYYM